MDKRIRSVAINEAVTLLNDHDESTCYLVAGKTRALLIDTANGWVDMAALCRELTPLPVTVVNTHGHCDHIFGNVYFSEARLHPADFALHDEHFAFPEMRAAMKKHGLKPAKLVPLREGETFDLGGLTLETVPLPGHTAGSVGLLDAKHRILFSGDGVIPHVWMQLPESLPIAALRDTLAALQREHGDRFDFLLTGHARGLEPAAIVDGLLAGCEQLLAGRRDGDRPYRWHGGECLAHRYDADENHCIVYDLNRL